MTSTDKNRSVPVTVYTASFLSEQGNMLYSFMNALAVRSRPAISISDRIIYSYNLTPDNKLLHTSYINCEEIEFKWNINIPDSDRNLCLSFELKDLKKINRIMKKEQASLSIVQNRNPSLRDAFTGPESSDDFIIYIGRGNTEREGLQSIPAIRINLQCSLVIQPKDHIWLRIPVATFKSMVKNFNKCKQDDQIKIKVFVQEDQGGVLITSKSNLNTGNIVESFGTIPDDSEQASDELETIEFNIDKDKIGHLIKFSSFDNTGVVRVYYSTSADLKLAYRFGSYGEQIVYINNGIQVV